MTELIRKTIRINKVQQSQIKKVLELAHYITEQELIRHALNLGLDMIEAELIDYRHKAHQKEHVLNHHAPSIPSRRKDD
jgi:hypothetical protein